MRPLTLRLAVLAAFVAVVASCDSKLPFSPTEGGGSTTTDPTDLTPPLVQIDSPATGMTLYLGDSVLMRIHAADGYGLKAVAVTATAVRQLPGGTTIDSLVYVQPVGTLINGDRSVDIVSWVRPVVPTDTNIIRVVFKAQAIDQNDNVADAIPRVVTMVRAPRVDITLPVEGDLVRAGATQDIAIHAVSSQGLRNIGFQAVSQGTGWTTPVAARDSVVVTGNDTTRILVLTVPIDAPANQTIVITGFATDIAGQRQVSAPRTVTVRSAAQGAPVVNQQVPPRAEIDDTILVTVDGESVTTVGAVVHRTTGTPADTAISYSMAQLGLAVYTGKKTLSVPLNLGQTWQGRQVTITSFARDASNRTGWSTTSTITPQTDSTRGVPSVATIVYGRTFRLPVMGGLAGDIAVDTVRGRAFVSNTPYNRLDVWRADVQAFIPNGVAVGSQPWGMSLGNADTLLVANSGGTNISRVPIAVADPTTIREALAKRINTRNIVAYNACFTRDGTTQRVRWTVEGPISFSDRPQYVAQSAAGRVYFSTKPTATNPAGTVRYLDPRQTYPDTRIVFDYADVSDPSCFAVFNADRVTTTGYPNNDPRDDILTLYDHVTGTANPDGSIFGASSDFTTALNAVNAAGGDVEGANVSLSSLPLSDTTFVSVSGTRDWIAFGEGNKPGAARVMLTYDNDPLVVRPFFSPGLSVKDLMDNASEPVFGVALDYTGALLGVHGQQSHISTVNSPFHLRLQGKYDSFDAGAGIAFHPYADGNDLSNGDRRLFFVASANGQIEVVDAAYFINRGSLPILSNFYGPLRVSAPFPGDAARGVILKLFGLTNNGLVVIDLTAADIKPSP